MWTYNGVELEEKDVDNYVGFVYMITNLIDGRKYIGKKLFTRASIKTIKKVKKKVRVSSNWRDYAGSNTVLQADVAKFGLDKFKREILFLCKTRSECNYLETLNIFTSGALLSDEFYNDWVTCKIHKKHLKGLRNEKV